ncbi:MAG TPA: hypothetical protein VMV15_08415 [Candidatus Binataceae bacterium]|nr:hypothetical protein [Candidatus Binataceae bacterium]
MTGLIWISVLVMPLLLFAQEPKPAYPQESPFPQKRPCLKCFVQSAQPDLERNAPWLLKEWEQKGLNNPKGFSEVWVDGKRVSVHVPPGYHPGPNEEKAQPTNGDEGSPVMKAERLRMQNGEP